MEKFNGVKYTSKKDCGSNFMLACADREVKRGECVHRAAPKMKSHVCALCVRVCFDVKEIFFLVLDRIERCLVHFFFTLLQSERCMP